MAQRVRNTPPAPRPPDAAPETPESPEAAGPPTDFRATAVARRRSWYGAKRHVKRVLGWRLPNLAMRAAVGVAAPGLRATGRLPVPAGVREVTGRVDGAAYTMLAPARCVVAKELYWGGGRRPGAADDLALRVFAAVVREADVFLDIGAYTGLFTLAGTAVNPRLRAHAFEIVPEVYRALFDNCVRNRVLHRTTLHHVGVGDPASVIAMPVRSGDSALPCFYSAALAFDDGVPVEVVALDAFAGAVPQGGRAVLKIDVEGTEADVFAHGGGFLAAHRPDILCEVLPDADAAPLTAALAPLGYRFHLVGERALAPAGPLAAHPRFRDWFCTTRSDAELAALGVPVA
ncbi:FkbM family methyltransferase [Nocardiopsis trehalosi]|uniref:FkbM family methyltransferase n=1 Tax=Nocardiopsis trehalosi TaxID=109329 RepID=UPI000A001301|nr:FkbM family methyltransferase [Nocardiopsis trehalosi]